MSSINGTVAECLGALAKLLQGRVVFGLFLFCGILLLLDHLGVVPLSALGPFGWTLVFVATLFFGCLFFASVAEEGYNEWKRYRAQKQVRARQQAKRDERERARAKFEEGVLRRLDCLSPTEHRILADCLRRNAPSFERWVYSSPVANLRAAGLVGTPGGTAHGDHYPYYVTDFVWEALLARREEFLARDDENQRRKEEDEREASRRPRSVRRR